MVVQLFFSQAKVVLLVLYQGLQVSEQGLLFLDLDNIEVAGQLGDVIILSTHVMQHLSLRDIQVIMIRAYIHITKRNAFHECNVFQVLNQLKKGLQRLL